MSVVKTLKAYAARAQAEPDKKFSIPRGVLFRLLIRITLYAFPLYLAAAKPIIAVFTVPGFAYIFYVYYMFDGILREQEQKRLPFVLTAVGVHALLFAAAWGIRTALLGWLF